MALALVLMGQPPHHPDRLWDSNHHHQRQQGWTSVEVAHTMDITSQPECPVRAVDEGEAIESGPVVAVVGVVDEHEAVAEVLVAEAGRVIDPMVH